MNPKRKKPPEHVDSHRWVVSYADFITLLFAFFVVMYAISSVNVSKYQSLAEGMHSAFNKKDQRRPSDIMKEHSKTSQLVLEDKKSFNAFDNALADLKDSDFIVSRHDGWIELDIKAGTLFDSASSDLKPQAYVKLMKIANQLKNMPYPITLEGYTDNIPIQTPRFPSNWELSSARAAAVARVLSGFGVNTHHMTVIGYGERYPVANNATEKGRARNRRVNIVIARDRTVPRLLNPDLSNSGILSPGPSVIPAIKLEKKP